jgi:hypothetical protein
MPFSYVACDVSGRLKVVCKRFLAQRQTQMGIRRVGWIFLVAKLRWAPPRDHSRPAGRVLRLSHIPAGAADVVFCQRIQVERFEIPVAVHADLGVALVIGERR